MPTRKPIMFDEKFVEVPAVPEGTIFRCVECNSNRIAYPVRTIDLRWAFGRCGDCRKRVVCNVISPG